MRRRRTSILVASTLVVLTLTLGFASPGFLRAESGAPVRTAQAPSSLGAAVVVGPNVGIVGETPPDRQQVEPTIAVDPRNPSILVAGAQDLRLVAVGEHRWHGFYRSMDGGQTWNNMLLPGSPGDSSPQGLASPLRGFNATSDPVLAFDRNGNLYYVGLVLNITSSGFIPNTGLFVAKFTFDGGVYDSTQLVSAGVFPDKPWIAVDTTGGPFDGNVYVAYDANLTATQFFGTLFTRSIDGGKTWSQPFYAPADMTGELAGMAIDPSGNVYVSDDAFDAVTEAFLGFIEVTKIVNGGTMIAQTVRAAFPFLIPSPLPGGFFRTFTIPQMAADQNGVYLVWDDFRTGSANVLFERSTDGGSSWSSPLTINDVPTGQHFFPSITASGGIISIAWYDSRLNSGSTINSLDVFYSFSSNGGATFSPNVRVTQTSFNPNLVRRTDSPGPFQVFMGDYIQVAASPSAIHIAWTDNRNACDTFDSTFGCVDQDVYTQTIAIEDFTITVSPGSLTVPLESSTTSMITLTSINGFTGTMTLSATVTPTTKLGPTATLSSPSVTLMPDGSVIVILTVSAKGSTQLGSYVVTITASSGSLAHSVSVTVTVVKETHGT